MNNAKINPEWLKFIPLHAEQELVAEFIENDLQDVILENRLIPVEFTITASSKRWVDAMAELHGSSLGDVVETCVQLGRYMGNSFPWIHQPNTNYVEGVLNCRRLMGRISALREKLDGFCSRTETIITITNDTRQIKDDYLTRDSFPNDASWPQGDVDEEEVDGPLSEEEITYNKEQFKDFAKPDAGVSLFLAGDLVHYLYTAALARNEPPAAVLSHLLNSAEFLDFNFPDLKHRTLRERLLIKVLQARCLAHKINKILSALETFAVDWEVALKRMSQRAPLLSPRDINRASLGYNER